MCVCVKLLYTYLYFCRECVCACVCDKEISISVSAADGPNTQFCYSLVSRPCLIARQEQQQETVYVFAAFSCVWERKSACAFLCVCSQKPSSTSQAVGRTPCRLGHMPICNDASCLKWLSVCVSICACVSLGLLSFLMNMWPWCHAVVRDLLPLHCPQSKLSVSAAMLEEKFRSFSFRSF